MGAALVALATSACDGCGAGGLAQAGGRLELEPSAVEFGYVILGQQKEAKVQLRNTGRGLLKITAVDRSDGFPDDVRYTPRGNVELEPGDTAPLTLVFQPSVEGAAKGTLLLRNDSVDAVVELPVHGIGVVTHLVAEPDQVDFGPVILDEIGEKTVQLSNRGESPLDVVIEPMSGDMPALFNVAVGGTDRSLLHLESGATGDLVFTFRPAVVGDASAQLSVRACHGCEPPLLIRLRGKGIAAGLVPDPDPLDFGSVLPGHGVVKTLKFHNVGNRRIGITDMKPAQAGTEFSVTRPAAGWPVLDPGATGEVDISYAPVSMGADQTQFVVSTDDARTPFFGVNVKGYGGGPSVDVAPTRLTFGDVGIGFPVTRRLVVSNKGVNDPGSDLDDLVIGAVDLPQGSDYAWAPTGSATLPLRIAPGGREVLLVTFNPTHAGDQNGTLVLHSNDGAESALDVPLQASARLVPPCDYELLPAASPGLQFGVVSRGRSARLSFGLRNVGVADCVVGKVDLANAAPGPFSLPAGPVYGQTLHPAERLVVEVDFSPPGTAAGGVDYTAEVEVDMSSTRAPVQMMQLSGRGAEVCLSITPTAVDFGVVEPLCETNSRTFTVYNACRTPVTVQRVALGLGVGEFVVLAPSVPRTLDPQGEMHFDARFRPTDVGPAQGTVEVYTDQAVNGGRPFVLQLSGSGEHDAAMTETFVQADEPRADILLVVDNSGSMEPKQQALANNFGSFMRFAVSQQIDYHIAVTNTETSAAGCSQATDGAFLPLTGPDRIITPNTRDPQGTFQQHVNVGADGCASEAPLEAAFLALSDPKINTTNAGFLRADAFLSVIVVTDEIDQSQRSVDFYVNFFSNVKGPRGSNLVSVSGIVGTTDPECDTSFGDTAEFEPRSMEVSRRTGGISESICTDNWSLALQKLGLTAFGYKSRFVLGSQPDPATLRVFVDGVEVPAGALWAYSADTNSVDFLPTAIPPAQSVIRVSYVVACN